MTEIVKTPPKETPENQTSIPKPREEDDAINYYRISTPIGIFATELSDDALTRARAFVAEELKNPQQIKPVSFLKKLLEVIGSIPPELSAEDSEVRETLASEVDNAHIEFESYFTQDGDFKKVEFSEKILSKLDQSVIDEYAVTRILKETIISLRAKRQEKDTEALIKVQRLALVGISRQIIASKK